MKLFMYLTKDARMKKMKLPFFCGLIFCFLLLGACIGLPSLDDPDETTDLPFGPQVTQQEHQTQVFESLWGHLEENYIYYESSDLDWDSLHEKYAQRIESGLNSEEFNALLDQLESDLPENEILFQTRSERIEDDLANTLSYGGIGAFVGFQSEDVPHVVILDVIPDSPAEKAGLQAHDSILAIDGEPVRLEEGLDAVQRVRGPAGTNTVLTIRTPGQPDREVELTRAQLSRSGILKTEELDNGDLGYVLFPPSVPVDMADEFILALTKFSSNENFKGLILDLRISNATAGWPLEAMLTIFQDGNIGEVYDRNDSQPVEVDGQDMFGSQEMPIVILVGENTRGLPEVFAAAMQSNHRATVIGSNTSGSIETLAGYLLPDGSVVFIANTSFHFPEDHEVGIEGIIPQVQIEARWDEIVEDEDPVIQSAIESFEVTP
jgi:carboxyl-terminal processing protease